MTVLPILVAFVPMLAVVGLIVVLFVTMSRRERERQARAQALADQIGWEVHLADMGAPELRHDVFNIGRGRSRRYVFWRAGDTDSVFQYRYTTGSGKNRRVHHRTIALVQLPFGAPYTEIGPEGFFSEIGRLFGVRDIEVESPVFNERFRVTSEDERFAVTLLDPAMIGFMTGPEGGIGSLRLELHGPWMACVSGTLEIEQLPGYLEFCQGLRERLPQVLRSLYPVAA